MTGNIRRTSDQGIVADTADLHHIIRHKAAQELYNRVQANLKNGMND